MDSLGWVCPTKISPIFQTFQWTYLFLQSIIFLVSILDFQGIIRDAKTRQPSKLGSLRLKTVMILAFFWDKIPKIYKEKNRFQVYT